ncbi:MAG: hypothetical protein U1E15_09785 [Hyphomicrobiales bacterium]
MTAERQELNQHRLFTRTLRNLNWAVSIISVSLAAGILGYMRLGPMDLPNAFANAAMILSGMGPLDKLTTPAGLIFEGVYALICGLVLFTSAGLALAPLLHHMLSNFHLEEK